MTEVVSSGGRRAKGSGPTMRSGKDLCQTCQGCRRKKVRCDGLHPKCGACRARAIECEYPQDARKVAIRRKQPNIKQLQRQLEEISRQISNQYPATVFEQASGAAIENWQPSRSDTNFVPATEHEHTLEGRSLSSNTLLESNNCYPINIEESFDLRRGLRVPLSKSPLNTTGQDMTSQNQEPEHISGSLLPVVTESVLRGSGIQVFGPTSLLHDHSSNALLSPSVKTALTEDSSRKKAIRDELVSNAALRRQDEAMLHCNPSFIANIDFDGVPVDMAMHLLDLYWNRQHFTYLLAYRPAIMDSLVHNGPHINKLLLNAMYLSTSLYSDRCSWSNFRNPGDMGSAFYERFTSLLARYVDQPTIPTAVAFLVGGSCLVAHGKQSAGWVFCGIGYRMVIDLGCHLDIPNGKGEVGYGLTALDFEIRRRTYWGAFVCDKFQSLFLGRMPALDPLSSSVPSEYLDSYEEREEWKPYMDPLHPPVSPMYRGAPTYAISTFQTLLRLSKVANHIVDSLYTISSGNKSRKALLEARQLIRIDLGNWRQSVPLHLQFDPCTDPTPPPHQITPHLTYWALVILSEQPFLRDAPSNFHLDPISQAETKHICIDAALNIWRLVEAYERTFTLRRAQYGILYATYCAVFVILQQTDEDCGKYAECIEFFWHVLSKYRMGCWDGLKRPLKLLRLLMYRFKQLPHGTGTGDSIGPDPTAIEIGESRPVSSIVCVSPAFEQDPTSEIEPDGEWTEWLNTIEGDTCFTDDTIFGIFMQE